MTDDEWNRMNAAAEPRLTWAAMRKIILIAVVVCVAASLAGCLFSILGQ
jgi:hypothetical protein